MHFRAEIFVQVMKCAHGRHGPKKGRRSWVVSERMVVSATLLLMPDGFPLANVLSFQGTGLSFFTGLWRVLTDWRNDPEPSHDLDLCRALPVAFHLRAHFAWSLVLYLE